MTNAKKKNRSPTTLAATAILLVSAPFASNASLIGDTVMGATSGVGFNWSSNSAVVGPGVEFSAVLTNATVLGDFTADTFTLSYENTSNFPNITFPAGSYVFQDLDWVGMNGIITGLTELSNTFPGAASFATFFADHAIQINVPLTNTNPGDLFAVTYRIETTHVPEPGTALLLGAGLLGLGLMRRGKRVA